MQRPETERGPDVACRHAGGRLARAESPWRGHLVEGTALSSAVTSPAAVTVCFRALGVSSEMTSWRGTAFTIPLGGCYSSRGFSGLQRLRERFSCLSHLMVGRSHSGTRTLLSVPVESMLLRGHRRHQRTKGQGIDRLHFSLASKRGLGFRDIRDKQIRELGSFSLGVLCFVGRKPSFPVSLSVCTMETTKV